MVGNIEYVEIANSSSVNKFNVSFLKKSGNLFGGLTIILYLWGVVRNVERYKILYDFLGLSYANKGWLVRVALFLYVY